MISQRARNLKPSPTLALAAKAKELASHGHDVISLSVGEPDWSTFECATSAGIEAIRTGQTKYSPANGFPELRSEIAKQTNQDLGTSFSAQQVTVTAGAKFVIFSALQATLDAGDEVLIPAPYWVSYPAMVELADAQPVIVETRETHQFKMSPEVLERAITSRTKMLILNSPSNPTGEIYTRDELAALARVLERYPRIIVLSDDIYNRLVFNDEGLAPHILHVAPHMASRTIVVNGASKTYAMTGWRLGWALGPQEIITAMTNYQSQSVSCAPTMSQFAGLAALQKAEGELKKSVQLLKERRNLGCELLDQIPGLKTHVAGGAFYLWPNISSYFGKTRAGQKIQNSSDFCRLFLEHEKVAAVPGIEFGCEGFMRISYALEAPRMREAMERLRRFIASLED